MNSKYICDRCKKEFKKKSNLDDHSGKKKPCESYDDRVAKEKEEKRMKLEEKQMKSDQFGVR